MSTRVKVKGFQTHGGVNDTFTVQKAVQCGWDLMNERERVTGKEVEAEGVSQRKGSEGLSENNGGDPGGFETGGDCILFGLQAEEMGEEIIVNLGSTLEAILF